MALRVAIASGNWSNPATWNAGLKPVAGDIAASNGFTVTIDENCNVDSITNAAQSPVKVTPNMTSYTTPSGIVTASSENTGGRNVWLAFDGNGGTLGQLGVGGAGWIAYEFPTPIVINAYSWVSGTNEQPSNWTFEGWNGSSWIVLHTVTGGAASYTSPLIGNNTAYIKYRINVSVTVTSTNRALWYEINLFEKGSDISATAGGTFILNNGVTVTCTNPTYGVTCATGTCITYAGTGTSTINAHILGSTTGSATTGIRVTGTGILNINGNLYGYLTPSDSTNTALTVTANATINIVGDVRNPNRYTIYISNQCTLNIIGNVYLGTYNNNFTIYNVGTSSVINLTGNIYGQGGVTGWNMTGVYLGAISTLNITGNLIGSNADSRSHSLVSAAANAAINVTGNMQSGTNGNIDFGEVCFYSTVNSYLNHIGSVIASLSGYALYSIGSGAINLVTGPFISSTFGMQPFYVSRMHYRRTIGSYYEFRNNSTNGALPPAASAPSTRLVSPDTVADSPIPANVRQGTSYAAGSQTGTMIVPSPSNVANNVPVDNTVGTAVLDANAIWAVPLTSINTLNSIGRRVKNAATVETTAAQIQTTLNNNE